MGYKVLEPRDTNGVVMEIGYVRVSSVGQHTDRQLADVELGKIFEDKQSGKDKERPALQKCLDFVREGDTLHVHSIDRLARNLADLLDLLSTLTAKGVRVKFHKEHLEFTGDDSPTQKMHLQILGAVAEFERAIIKERQLEGIAIAKANKVYKGRKRTMTVAKIKELIAPVEHGMPVVEVARKLGVNRRTVYRWIELCREKTSSDA